MSTEMTEGQHALLARMRNGTLGSVGPDGAPHIAPVWYLWDGETVRVSTVRTAAKVRYIRRDPRVAFCVDDQVAGEYVTLYGTAEIIDDMRVTELTRPLLLAYHHPDEADARWRRISAGDARVIIMLRPARITGRAHVR